MKVSIHGGTPFILRVNRALQRALLCSSLLNNNINIIMDTDTDTGNRYRCRNQINSTIIYLYPIRYRNDTERFY